MRRARQHRPIYRRRPDAALEAVARSLPGAIPKRVAAGLHLYVQLPDWCDEFGLIDAAFKRGVHIEGASWHWSLPRSAPPALVLGCGAIDEAAMRDGLKILAPIYHERRASRDPKPRQKRRRTRLTIRGW